MLPSTLDVPYWSVHACLPSYASPISRMLPARDLYGDDGFPDADKITEAARALVERKPHLADRRPVGPVEQGPREEAPNVNLAGMLRSLAG